MSSEICPAFGVLTDERMDRVLTQYRESPNLLGTIRTYLNIIEKIHLQVCDLPSSFDIDSAVGDQLTIVGKRLGFPRTHSVCDPQPVFGFECEGLNYPVTGFCDDTGTWSDCVEFYQSIVTINDDETYRRFLKVRRFQMMQMFDIDSIEESAKILFGEQSMVASTRFGHVVIAPQRELTANEQRLIKIYPRVIPNAPGVEVHFHFPVGNIAGFGSGYYGFCEADESGDEIEGTFSNWLCPENVKPYEC